MTLREAWDKLRGAADERDDGPEYDCSAGRHEPYEIRAADSGKPLAVLCKRCRKRLDEAKTST